ncbi:MAG: hypothetical protein U9R42_06770, partial [Bacteroidota bacterium]|nr:hypothetical protein [Bacteroidota bacterium]
MKYFKIQYNLNRSKQIIVIILLIIFTSYQAISQSYNVVPVSRGRIDFNNSPPVLTLDFSNFSTNILCDLSGKKTLKANLFNKDINLNGILGVKRTIYESNMTNISNSSNCFIILPSLLKTNKFHLFAIDYNYLDMNPPLTPPYTKWMYHYIVTTHAHFNYDVKLISKMKHDTFITALAAGYTYNKQGYWLVAQDIDLNFYSYKIDNDNVLFPVKSELSGLYNSLNAKKHDKSYEYRHSLRLSNTSSYMINTVVIIGGSKILIRDHILSSYFFDFNPHNGKVTFRDTIAYQDFIHTGNNKNSVGLVKGIAFSPNDSFFYLGSEKTALTQYSTTDLKNYKVIINKENNYANDLILANNAKIYFVNKAKNTNLKTYVINLPNKKGMKCDIKLLDVVISDFFPYTLFENLATKIIYKNTCERQPNFDVICDTSKYKKFRWCYLNDSVSGKKVRIDFPNSGEYIVTL